MARPLIALDAIALDLETTGGTPLYDRITEIALIRFENGVELIAGKLWLIPVSAFRPLFRT